MSCKTCLSPSNHSPLCKRMKIRTTAGSALCLLHVRQIPFIDCTHTKGGLFWESPTSLCLPGLQTDPNFWATPEYVAFPRQDSCSHFQIKLLVFWDLGMKGGFAWPKQKGLHARLVPQGEQTWPCLPSPRHICKLKKTGHIHPFPV